MCGHGAGMIDQEHVSTPPQSDLFQPVRDPIQAILVDEGSKHLLPLADGHGDGYDQGPGLGMSLVDFGDVGLPRTG